MEEQLFRILINKMCRSVSGLAIRAHFSWRDPSKFMLRKIVGGCRGGDTTLVEEKGKSYLTAKLYYQGDTQEHYLTMVMLRSNFISFYDVAPVGGGKYSEDIAFNISLNDPELITKMEDELTRRWESR